jgi:hypothetical protein
MTAISDMNTALIDNANQDLINTLEQSNINMQTQNVLHGCGLGYLASRIKEHYSDDIKRYNKLQIRLIGDQAIALGRYSYRLIDSLHILEESPAQKLRITALSKISEYLRNAGGLFNKIHTNMGEIEQLEEYCQLYFNLLVLFFPSSVNVTVCTVGYAMSYRDKKLYEKCKVGYGILSLQAKESKHAGLKGELSLVKEKPFRW